ncbi:uncharacterized protein [Oscarella lobularis]|uniref:uncharacterized protein n=1 Tax=Oscarella lobularis TaxID=121494 RepID=UPI003313F75A
MLRVLVVLSLALLCVAQPGPHPPRLSSEFTATMTVNLTRRGPRGEESFTGKGSWAGDIEHQRELEMLTLEVRGGEEIYHVEFLQRVDEEHVYMIESNGTGEAHCRGEPARGQLVSPWEFLDHNPHYERRTINGREFAVYAGADRRGHAQLLFEIVNDQMSDHPFAYAREEHLDHYDFVFESFQEVTPPETIFAVPAECNQ